MTIIRNVAKALLALTFFTCSMGVSAAPDGLLEQIRSRFEQKGSNGVAELAKGYGLSTRVENNQLLVPVIIDRRVGKSLRFNTRLAQAGGRIDASSRSYIRLMVPASRLDTLIKLFPNERLRAPIPNIADFGQGSLVSQSVALTAADGYQAGNLDGTGVKVAVVDLGFKGLANAISVGELPANTVSVDCTIGLSCVESGVESLTDIEHGVGVAEHVADMAPGAQLYCLLIKDTVSLQNAADYIRDNEIRIANLSVAWVTASYYDDTGPINTIINDSYFDGIFWTVSSGNFRRKHWRGGWLDSNGNNRLDFSGTDDQMALSPETTTASIFLNWNQYGDTDKTDLDLYVLDADGNTVKKSIFRQSSNLDDPVEYVTFGYNVRSKLPYSVVVELVSGSTADLDITLFSFNHEFEHYVTSSSTADPASASGAFTVGAVSQSAWNNTNPGIRSYSSEGPTNDGRRKPDLVAPDGTSSLTYGTANGTSFSAPTTAGAAALLLEENGTLAATALGNLLRTQAVDIGIEDPDNISGDGKLQLPLINSDSDELTNVDEISLGTDALDGDTDNDGLDDYQETQTYGTNPLISDTDSDGVNDYDEVNTWGSDPLTSGRGDLAPHGSPDNNIDLGDYIVLTRMVTGDILPTTAEIIYGDLNNNGELDVGDLVIMKRVITGEIPLP